MLSKQYRLAKRTDLEVVRKQGKLVRGQTFGLLFLENKLSNKPRFGFIVSKKISRLAVKRNRVKRLFREAVTKIIKDVKAENDYLFLVNTKSLDKDLQDILKDVTKTFRDNNLLNK